MLNFIVNEVINDASSDTTRFIFRWREVSLILVHVYESFVFENEDFVFFSGVRYCFDDFLVLMFEFVQLNKIFYNVLEENEKLEEFCSLHCQRLMQLCISGRLSYIDEIIIFRKQIVEGVATNSHTV